MAEHDQRFKQLLREFFPEFVHLFFPEFAALFDFTTTEWLDKEQLLDPPHGEVLEVDLLARLRLRDQPDADAVAVIHIEVESRDDVAAIPRRMYEYYQPLWRKFEGRVLPIALYLRVGFDGIGVETYAETVGALEVLRFQYLYVGLPALDAATYLHGDNVLGVALAALMRMPRDRRALNRADALRRLVVECQENPARLMMLEECLSTYLKLDAAQERVYEELLKSPPYLEVQPMYKSKYEMILEEGREQERRNLVRKMLARRFGSLPAETIQRLDAMTLDQLEEVALALIDAGSLQALGLAD